MIQCSYTEIFNEWRRVKKGSLPLREIPAQTLGFMYMGVSHTAAHLVIILYSIN